MAKNEKTSPRVATKASGFLRNSEIAMQNLKAALVTMEVVLEAGREIAASALTQAPDRPAKAKTTKKRSK